MLYFVTRPDNAHASNPVFTRFRGLTKNLAQALKLAKQVSGKVFSTDGNSTNLVKSFFTFAIPTYVPESNGSRVHRANKAQAAIFDMPVVSGIVHRSYACHTTMLRPSSRY